MEEKILYKLKFLDNKTALSLVLASAKHSFLDKIRLYIDNYNLYTYTKEQLSQFIFNLYKKGLIDINVFLNYYQEKEIVDEETVEKYPFLKSMNDLEKENLKNSGNFIYLTKIYRRIEMKKSPEELYNNLKTIKSNSENCKKCSLRNQPFVNIDISNVISDNVDILFVGEAPGEEETKENKPFVGRSGKLLRSYISKLGNNVSYAVANTCLCRPPDNRTPTPHEIDCCLPNLFTVIETLNPKLIVACGLTSYRGLTLKHRDKKNIEMRTVRGLTAKYKDIPIYTIYHPSYILRSNNVNLYNEDFSQLKKMINKSLEEKVDNNDIEKYQHKFRNVYKKLEYEFDNNLCYVKLDSKYYDTSKYTLLNIERYGNYVLYYFRNEIENKTEYLVHEVPTYYYSSERRKYFLNSSDARLHISYDEKTVQTHTYERNFPVTSKCYTDYKLHIEDVEKTGTYDYCILDIEVLTNSDEFPDQTFANYPVCLVTIYSSLDNKLHTYVFDEKNIYKDSKVDVYDNNNEVISQYDVVYHYFDNERDLLLSVSEMIRKHDVVLAWNIIFDIPYIMNRMKNLSLDPDRYLTKITSLRPYVDMKYYRIQIPGVIVVDALNLYKIMTRTEGEKESYKLDYIASIELNASKTSSGKLFYKLWDESRERACYYNQIDVCLTKLILDKFQAIEFNNKLRHIYGVSWDSIDSQSQGVESMLHFLAKEKKMVFIDREDDKSDTSGFEGGFVHEPLQGVRYVSVFDFSSLYPSIIITLNIGNDSLRARIPRKDHFEKYVKYRLFGENEDKYIDAIFYDDNMNEVNVKMKISEFHERVRDYTFSINGTFFTREQQSLISELSSRLLQHRDKYKKLYKQTKDVSYNSMQLVYKVGANSIYGYTGYKYGILYDRNVAQSITKQGQILNKYCSLLYESDFQDDDKTIIDKLVTKYYGINDQLERTKVIYGDTDSVMCTIPTNSDLDKLIPELDEKFNTRLRNLAVEIFNCFTPKWKLSYEKTGYLYVVTKRRYALYRVHPDEELMIKGLEVRKVNYPKLLKDAYINILYMLLRDKKHIDEISEYIKDVEREYRNTYKKLDISVGIPVIWAHDKETYKVSNPAIKGMLLYNSLIRKVFVPGSRGYQFDIRFNPLTSEYRRATNEYLKSLSEVIEKVNIEKEMKEIRSIVIPYDITDEERKLIDELISKKIIIVNPEQAVRTFWYGKLEDFGLNISSL